jgi:hypothetical protein
MDDDQALGALSQLVNDLRTRGPLDLRPDRRNPLVYTTVVGATRVGELGTLVAEMLGPAYKPAGESARWKNWFDPFVKSVGGIEAQQTLYRKELEGPFSLYCAFWPWASEPTRCSLRVGLSCLDTPRRVALEDRLR